ncbi:MAG: hypothetical protein KGM49_00725 [Sphingomonadales bacterium]|nr:hypothetical protein [Sphingomonadales bacterium]
MTDQSDIVERAKSDAISIRFDPGIPVRVFERDGVVVWSKVDSDMRDLTTDNSEGLLHHVRSIFVPHGMENPLAEILDLREKLAKAEGALRPFTEIDLTRDDLGTDFAWNVLRARAYFGEQP